MGNYFLFEEFVTSAKMNEQMDNLGVGLAEGYYKTLQANNVFENSDESAADEFVDSDGTNNTVLDFDVSVMGLNYILIEATSVSTNLHINDCLTQQIDTTKWLFYCTIGTDEERRAKLLQTLFYDDKATSSNIVGLIALKTSVSRDIGKRAYYSKLYKNSTNTVNELGTYTGTFSDITNNNSCSSWSYISVTDGSTNKSVEGSWQVPSGTKLNSKLSTTGADGGPFISDEIGIDLTADEKDNPIDCVLEGEILVIAAAAQSMIFDIRTFMLCSGSVSWVLSGIGTPTLIDYNVDRGMVDFTAITETITGTDAIFDTDKYICKGGSGAYENSGVLCNKNIITFDDSEKGIVVFGKVVNTENTLVTINISDGITTISNKNFNEYIDISSLNSGILKITFNLNTTNVNDTPEIYGYGVKIIR